MMEKVFELFVTSSLLILTIALIRKVFCDKLNVHLQYALWIFVVIKLLVFPIPQLTSTLSVQSVLHTTAHQIQSAWQNASRQSNTDAEIQTDSTDTALKPQDRIVENTSSRFGTALNSKPIDHSMADKQSKSSAQKAFWLWAAIGIFGSIMMLLYFVIGNFRLAKYLRKNRICQNQMGFPLPVYLVDGLPSPCLYGRAVYLTKELAADSVRSRHVLMHEYCHYRQGDLIWSALRCLCIICYWWNPLVWLAAAFSKQDCEMSCDQAALRHFGEEERFLYGKTLLSLLEVTDRPKNACSISDFIKRSFFNVSSINSAFLDSNFKKRGTHPMKQRIQKIARQSKSALPVCIFASVLSLACFISVSTAAPTAQKEMQTADSKTAKSAGRQSAASIHDEVQKKPKVNTKADTKQQVAETNGIFDLDQAVSHMLLLENKDRFAPGECVAEGHIILESEQTDDGFTNVYVLTMYGEYAFENGYFLKESGTGVIPAVLRFAYDSSLGYVPKTCEYPMDGEGYGASIRKMFPKQLQERCIDISQADEKELIRQERVYAKQYLKDIGRKASIGEYGDIDHPLLTDAGVSVKVSNRLCSRNALANYPDWIGDLERIEHGVRYRYALELDQKSREIIYTKQVYENWEPGDTIEDIRIDMDTGKIKKIQTSF